MRDQRTGQRVRDRGDDDAMPSLTVLLEPGRAGEAAAPDLLAAFAVARQSSRGDAPDLMAAFDLAARRSSRKGNGDGSQNELYAFGTPRAEVRQVEDLNLGRKR